MLSWQDELTVLNVAFLPCHILCSEPSSGRFFLFFKVDTFLSLQVSCANIYI